MATSRLDAAYVAQVKAVRAKVNHFALARFGAGEYRDADLERFLKAVVPAVIAGRLQTSALTDAYLAQVLSAKLGRKVAPRGPLNLNDLRGVPVTEVYARPYVTVRTKLSDGLDFIDAVSAGTARLVDIVATDMQLAKTTTARSVLADTEGVTGYRRVLSGPSCELCSSAAEQRYWTDDLMPIHPGCNCGVEPLTEPTGRFIESKTVAVHDHGEIGPMLTSRGDHFTGPAAVSN